MQFVPTIISLKGGSVNLQLNCEDKHASFLFEFETVFNSLWKTRQKFLGGSPSKCRPNGNACFSMYVFRKSGSSIKSQKWPVTPTFISVNMLTWSSGGVKKKRFVHVQNYPLTSLVPCLCKHSERFGHCGCRAVSQLRARQQLSATWP